MKRERQVAEEATSFQPQASSLTEHTNLWQIAGVYWPAGMEEIASFAGSSWLAAGGRVGTS